MGIRKYLVKVKKNGNDICKTIFNKIVSHFTNVKKKQGKENENKLVDMEQRFEGKTFKNRIKIENLNNKSICKIKKF